MPQLLDDFYPLHELINSLMTCCCFHFLLDDDEEVS